MEEFWAWVSNKHKLEDSEFCAEWMHMASALNQVRPKRKWSAVLCLSTSLDEIGKKKKEKDLEALLDLRVGSRCKV